MSTKWRRFEVMLPRLFNDGSEVPGEWISRAILEVVDHFGAVTHETQHIEGHWHHEGVYYRDDLARVVVDVPDTPKNRQWMKRYKAKWKKQLEQLQLWMVSYRIEIE